MSVFREEIDDIKRSLDMLAGFNEHDDAIISAVRIWADGTKLGPLGFEFSYPEANEVLDKWLEDRLQVLWDLIENTSSADDVEKVLRGEVISAKSS